MPTSSPLFVDTSGWALYFDQDEPDHALAASLVAVALRQGRTLVTTNYVVGKLVALFSSRRLRVSHAEMVTAVTLIKSEPSIQVEHIDPTTDDAAWQLVVSRADKRWSLVDAVSFVVMQRLGITEALTTDHHFDQAGLVRLLGA